MANQGSSTSEFETGNQSLTESPIDQSESKSQKLRPLAIKQSWTYDRSRKLPPLPRHVVKLFPKSSKPIVVSVVQEPTKVNCVKSLEEDSQYGAGVNYSKTIHDLSSENELQYYSMDEAARNIPLDFLEEFKPIEINSKSPLEMKMKSLYGIIPIVEVKNANSNDDLQVSGAAEEVKNVGLDFHEEFKPIEINDDQDQSKPNSISPTLFRKRWILAGTIAYSSSIA